MTAAIRLDKLLVERGLAGSRHRAELLIKEQLVSVEGKVIDRSGKKFDPDVAINVSEGGLQWVSRGALKLEAAFETWPNDITDALCLDVGASTGGFTEVLLDRGVKKVFAVDTGHGQLAESLRDHHKVINLERTNIRYLEAFPVPMDVVVIDVSFISIQHVLEALPNFVKAGTLIYALVKPQFEVGRDNVGKKGIVRNEALYPKVLETVANCATSKGFKVIGHIPSPIKGGDGNTEFLMHLIYPS